MASEELEVLQPYCKDDMQLLKKIFLTAAWTICNRY